MKEKEKTEAYKDASMEAQMEQYRILANQAETVFLDDGRSFGLRPMVNYVAAKISGLIIRQVPIETNETAEIIAKMKPNLKLQSKVISLAILNDARWHGFAGILKRLFFYWIHWRIIDKTFSSADISIMIKVIIEKIHPVFFYQNMAYLKGINTMKKKMTKAEVKLLQAEQKLAKKTDS